MKGLLIILGCVLSWVIYGFGLIAPLTPSEGIPNVFELMVFVGIPLAILAWCWLKCSALWAKIFVIIQGITIIGFTSLLLLQEMGLFRKSS
jgi:hypothetical protein